MSDTTYLENENQRLRAELQAIYDERSAEREQMRADMRERARQSECEADNWEDAFAKGLARYRLEAATEVADNEQIGDAGDPYYQPDFLFSELVPKIERAQAIYLEKMGHAEVAIRRARQNARYGIADAIEREFPDDQGMKELAEAIRKDNHLWLVEW